MEPVSVQVEDARLEGELHGRDGPLVVASHGFPDVPSTWRHQVPTLVAAGFRVLTPWMRGYGPSGPGERHDVVRLGRDLLAWGDRLSPDAPFDLVGHDWGAIASYAAAAEAPHRIRRAAFVSVPPLAALFPSGRWPPAVTARQARRSWYIGFFQLPRWPEQALARPDGALVRRLWRDWSPGLRLDHDAMAAIVEAVRARPEAVLGPYRALLRRPGATLRLWSKVAAPSLYIHGEDDGCIGVELVEGLDACLGDLVVHTLPGGHFVQRESPDAVGALLRAHLTAGRAGA